MDAALRQQIIETLQASLGVDLRVAAIAPAGGSSFSHTARLTLHNGDSFFVKYALSPPPGMFEREFEALSLLHDTHTVQVPEPVCSGHAFIVTAWIESGGKAPQWHEALGHGLALLHRAQQSSRYGFDRDNYIGASEQHNGWHESWLEFWRERRLGAQLRMWRRHAAAGDALLRLGDSLVARLDMYLDAVREPGVLLHGDLWSGNAAADRNGRPVIYDPASYYGHREAEFGMMRLFGGFGPRVEGAYQEAWPFEPDSEDRIALYRLYHELNHLNLFGAAYYEQCLDTVKGLV